MARRMRIGSASNRQAGFSLIEMLVVLAIIGALAAVAAPIVTGAIVRAREAALKENLAVMRRLIDDYHADRAAFPASLEILVEEGYLRAVPPDPVNDGRRDWTGVEAKEGGFEDVRSSSAETGANGVPYARW